MVLVLTSRPHIWILSITLLFMGQFLVRANEADSLLKVIEQSYDSDKYQAQAELSLLLTESHPDSALSLANNALSFARWNQLMLKGICHLSIGEAYFQKNKYDEALTAYYISDSLFNKIKNSKYLSRLKNDIGLVYYYRAEFDSAMLAFQNLLKLETALGNTLGIAKAHQNIGLVHYNLDHIEKFYEHLELALELYEQLDDVQHIAEIANNLAIAYVAEGDFDKGYKYYILAIKGFESIDDELNRANVLTNLGNLFYYKEEYDKAIDYLNEAISVFKELDNTKGLIHAHSRLGDIYFDRGLEKFAIKEYLKCETLNEQIKNRDVQLQNLKSLTEAYKWMEDYKNALRIAEVYQTLKDSVYNEEKLKTILALEKEYETAKAQQDLIILREKHQQRNILLIVVVVLAAVIIAFIYFWFRQRRSKENQRLVSLEQKVLRTQMSPHFLFNAMSAIQYFVLENKTVEAIDFIGDFSKLIRMVLQSSQEEFITLEAEKAMLENYLSLLSKRYDDKLKYIIHFDDNIDLATTLIPPMLAQPFIENSIEHGELGKSRDGNIWVSFSVENEQLKFRIQDDGIGIDRAQEKRNDPKKKPMAIRITRERLRLINSGSAYNNVALVIEDLSKYGKHGTLVEFSIPYHKMN